MIKTITDFEKNLAEAYRANPQTPIVLSYRHGYIYITSGHFQQPTALSAETVRQVLSKVNYPHVWVD